MLHQSSYASYIIYHIALTIASYVVGHVTLAIASYLICHNISCILVCNELTNTIGQVLNL
jgi:hypothetical protein